MIRWKNNEGMATSNPAIVVFNASLIPPANTSKLTFFWASISPKAVLIPITVPSKPSNMAKEAMVGNQWLVRSKGEKNKSNSSADGSFGKQSILVFFFSNFRNPRNNRKKEAKEIIEKAKRRIKIKIAGIENVQFMDVSTSMNQYKLPSQEKKPEYVRKNFDGIARAYDRFNDWNSFFLHRIWKDWVVKEAKKEVPHATSALDLCCGTGDITYRLSLDSHLKTVVGLDFSEQMLSYAFPKVEGKTQVKLIVGDAMDLKQFPEGSFDIVTMGFGLRNVSDLKKCLFEIKRVLKKDGVYVNLDVGRVRPKFLKFFADFYFFKIVPLFGYLLYGKQNEMFDYLPHSSKVYPDQESLSLILKEVGFSDVRFQNFVFGNAVAHIARKGK